MSLDALFTEILQAREQALRRNAGPWPRNQPTASDLSTCAREMALSILHWQERPGFEPPLLARFEVGGDKEQPVSKRLAEYGFPVLEAQRTFELKGRTGQVVLRGRIDGMLAWQGTRVPFDIKTVDPLIFPKLQTEKDLREHPFFSKWVRQILAYCYLADAPVGFLLLENLKGQWRFIEVAMDYAEMERLVSDCERAVEAAQAVRKGAAEDDVLPGYLEDIATCRRCWAFGRLCVPPGMATGSLPVIDDAELEAQLSRRAELEPAAKEFEDVDKAIKGTVRGRDKLVVGDWLITGKELTVNYKAQPARVATQWRVTIDKLLAAPQI